MLVIKMYPFLSSKIKQTKLLLRDFIMEVVVERNKVNNKMARVISIMKK